MCLALRCGTQIEDVRMFLALQTCLAFVLRTCFGAALQMYLALRLGAHLADAPLVALGRPTWVRPYKKVYLQAKNFSYPSSSSSFRQVLPCVDIFVADEFFVWAPILRTRLALRLGTQLPDVPCVALGRPSCGRVGVPCIWADVRVCLAFGCPTSGRALHLCLQLVF
jgi:hypothetical protein